MKQGSEEKEGAGMGIVTVAHCQSNKSWWQRLAIIGFVMGVFSRIFQVANILKTKSTKLFNPLEVLKGTNEQVLDLSILNGGKNGTLARSRKKYQIYV